MAVRPFQGRALLLALQNANIKCKMQCNCWFSVAAHPADQSALCELFLQRCWLIHRFWALALTVRPVLGRAAFELMLMLNGRAFRIAVLTALEHLVSGKDSVSQLARVLP